ncbi:MAG: DUF2461 domain-containing protein [Anaerolineales bacterium]
MDEVQAFNGFPPEGFRFFRELAVYNNREWFQEHKQDYIDYMQTPAVSLVVELGERLKSEFPGIAYDLRTNGAGSIMRIYRDIRFSKDKTPYKTHIGINFWEGPQKKGSPGFHLFIDSEGAAFYGGYRVFPKEYLTAYRQAVASDASGRKLRKALDNLGKVQGFEFGGEQLKKVPPGYDKDSPRGDLLRYKGLWVKSPKLDLKTLGSSKLVDTCAADAHTMGSMHRWFAEVSKTVSH